MSHSGVEWGCIQTVWEEHQLRQHHGRGDAAGMHLALARVDGTNSGESEQARNGLSLLAVQRNAVAKRVLLCLQLTRDSTRR